MTDKRKMAIKEKRIRLLRKEAKGHARRSAELTLFSLLTSISYADRERYKTEAELHFRISSLREDAAQELEAE